jgi:hypothetical protein
MKANYNGRGERAFRRAACARFLRSGRRQLLSRTVGRRAEFSIGIAIGRLSESDWSSVRACFKAGFGSE